MVDNNETAVLVIERGKPDLPPLHLEMLKIYEAEKRLREVAFVNPNTSQELSSFFNEICNHTTKYEAWVEFEILQACKNLDKVRSTIIIDKLPELAKKLKESGQKPSKEWREAVISKDPQFDHALDVLNALKATKALLHNKAESFKRAYFSAKDMSRNKERIGATPNLNTTTGGLSEPQQNFMGVTQIR